LETGSKGDNPTVGKKKLGRGKTLKRREGKRDGGETGLCDGMGDSSK